SADGSFSNYVAGVPSLPGSTTEYVQTVGGPNFAGALTPAVRASNELGQGPTSYFGLGSPTIASYGLGSLAAIPGTPAFSNVAQSSVTVQWPNNGTADAGGSNTRYWVERATRAAGPYGQILVVPAGSGSTSMVDLGLAPNVTYYYRVRGTNRNDLFTDYSATSSVTMLAPTLPSITGNLGYSGLQTGQIVLQAFTTSTFTGGVAAQVVLPVSAGQPYFLSLAGNATYWLRAFVDCGTVNRSCTAPFNGSLEAGEDRGTRGGAGGIAVQAAPVANQDFSVARDLVAPAAPSSLLLTRSLGRVNLAWQAPIANANGTTLADLAGFRIQRSTQTAGFQTIGLTTATAFSDLAPVAGFTNYYRVLAADLGANASAPSGVQSVVPLTGGTISGSVSTNTTTTSGAFRIRISTLASRGASFVSESTLNPYSFAGLVDGTYFVRGFRDTDFDNLQDDDEPAGTHGGLSAPFPLSIRNGNVISNATVSICDRTPIEAGTAIAGILSTSDCRALDQGPDFYTDVYTFRVGGGAAGSIGEGAEIEIRMDSSYGNRLFLLGPDGNVVAQDNRPGGAVIVYTVNQPGLYRIEPTSFDPTATGSYEVSLEVRGGFVGSISGLVAYAGSQLSGTVHVQLMTSADSTAFPVRVATITLSGATPYDFSGLPDGVYFVRSFRDVDGNLVRDSGEPEGAFGLSVDSPTAVYIYGGIASPQPADVTLTDPAVGQVAGEILREGSQTGTIRIEIGRRECPDCSDLNAVAIATRSGAGSYSLPFVPPATDYVLLSYVDTNENQHPDPLEAKASSSPVTVHASGVSTVNLLVRDPGIGAQGNATINGTITYPDGKASGTLYVVLANDPQFNLISYIVTLASTGTYTKGGVLGGTSYYIAAFIDTNANGNPDERLGEPLGIAGGSFQTQTPLFAPLIGAVTAPTIQLKDPPTGKIIGKASYSGAASGNLIVSAFRRVCSQGNCGDFNGNETVVTRTAATSHSFELGFLSAATDYNVTAFVDSNNNGRSDIGEPFTQFGQTICSGTGPCFGAPVAVSSGPLAFPTYGVDVTIQDAGGSGGGGGNYNNVGQLDGEVVYLGTQSGDIVVRLFATALDTPAGCSGTPRETLRLMLGAGSGQVSFSKSGLAFGKYCVDAFRDTSGSGMLNPTYNAYGYLATVELTQQRSFQSAYGDAITDPGQGGSVNAYTGSLIEPGGLRFDGGATDLALTVAVDTVSANGPFVYVLGITKQNQGTVFSIVKTSPTASTAGTRNFVSSVTLPTGNFPRLLVAPNGNVYVGSGKNGVAELHVFSSGLALQRTIQLFGGDVVSDLAWSRGYLYASMPALEGNIVRKLDPSTWITVATGTYQFPQQGLGSDTDAGGLAVDPNTGEIYVQASDFDTHLVALLKFGENLGSGPLVQDITQLSIGDDTDIGFDGVTGSLYLAAAPQGQDTAYLYKFNTGLGQIGSATLSPVITHFGAGLGMMSIAPDGNVYLALEAPSRGGDFLVARYDNSLVFVSSRTFNGTPGGTLEDGAAGVAAISSTQVFVAGVVNNGQNLDWAALRLDMTSGGSQSGGGTTVVITSNTATNAILGKTIYNAYSGATTTSGTVRAVLLDSALAPVRFSTSAFGASRDYVFNNLASGLYHIRAFLDRNGNLLPDGDEPFGGTGKPVFFQAAGNQT
ncbi:MAG: hypothetical protein HY554_02070, partial [Elusimicrobia bacterium]|nr:hypothetical protein [Elusimicrobiota bacterium]